MIIVNIVSIFVSPFAKNIIFFINILFNFKAWTIQHPDREHVLVRMDRAINRWNIKSNRNINYRSFAPIIKLAGVSHTPQCQMWAIWALANLTSVTPDKYCKYGIIALHGNILCTFQGQMLFAFHNTYSKNLFSLVSFLTSSKEEYSLG